jgi:spermidine/putrescine transport system permease protein
MVKRRVTPEINALSTLMFGAVLILLILVNILQMKTAPKGVRKKA